MVALGNLGKLGSKANVPEHAEDLIKKYLNYAKDLHHKNGMIESYLRLGFLNGGKGDILNGSENLKKAFELAQESQDPEKSAIASCTLGIVKAQTQIEDFQNMLKSKFQENIDI
jgi:hypothetical protein